jgi:hypothetical protein
MMADKALGKKQTRVLPGTLAFNLEEADELAHDM